MKFQVWIEVAHVSGPEVDTETVLDAFAYTVGRENGAKTKALKIVCPDYDAGDSVYVVTVVDDRP